MLNSILLIRGSVANFRYDIAQSRHGVLLLPAFNFVGVSMADVDSLLSTLSRFGKLAFFGKHSS